MPIYEYVCEKCHTSFDHLARSMAASGETVRCPKCQSEKTGRKLSVFAVATAEAKSSAPQPGMCGCGQLPGSCCMD
jgi:putative FmdB family regulatory protein